MIIETCIYVKLINQSKILTCTDTTLKSKNPCGCLKVKETVL